MYDIIVAGAGPAGLTAAIYGVRGGKSLLMLEEKMYGGQIVYASDVENYPGTGTISGADLVTCMYKQATDLGAKLTYAKLQSLEKRGDHFVLTDAQGTSYEAAVVIGATGVKPRMLGLEGEERLTGSGLSFCANCDGAFYKGKTVAVMGGGNTALEDADYLAALAKKVYLVHRRTEFRGESAGVEKLRKRPNVEFVLNAVPVKLLGETAVEGVIVRSHSGEERTLAVSGIFVAYGMIPQNEIFASLAELDENGYICADEDGATKTPGLFAAGDCRRKKRRQLVTATADGATAAMAAIEYLNAFS